MRHILCWFESVAIIHTWYDVIVISCILVYVYTKLLIDLRYEPHPFGITLVFIRLRVLRFWKGMGENISGGENKVFHGCPRRFWCCVLRPSGWAVVWCIQPIPACISIRPVASLKRAGGTGDKQGGTEFEGGSRRSFRNSRGGSRRSLKF